MANTPKLTVRFSVQDKKKHPCFTPIRWVVSHNKKRIYCTLNVPGYDAKQLPYINSDCTVKDPEHASIDANNTAATLEVIKQKIERIATEAIELGDWETFTSEDLKGILSCLYFWESDPNALTTPSEGLCWQWLCYKNGVNL